MERILNKDYVKKLVFILTIVVTTAFISGVLMAADLKDVKKKGVLRHLGIPYANFVTGAGDGMDIELMTHFAKYLGVRYEYVKTDWGDIFGDLTGKKVRPKGDDIEVVAQVPIKGDVAANGLTVLPWRKKAVDFSVPTFPNQVWLVARADSAVKPIKSSGNIEKDIEAVKKIIAGQPLLGKAGTCLDPSLYGLEKITDKIKLFPGSLNDIAPAVIKGESDLTLLDLPDALVALQKWPGKIKVIGPVSEKQDMAAAFSKDSPKLREAFNRFIRKTKTDGTYVRIVKKYYPYVFDYDPEFFRRNK
ncbi:MAG: transporter substrate-binding domain-containing protein [Deltaproteobacteria bacterium]|nr:transporter substrate-binding domain-containing protein [Deltaproteobacteria bacterium]